MSLSGKLSAKTIREKFIAYFEKQGHQASPSASLIPVNPTVLLTPAGMLPFVPIFLGLEPAPEPPRVVTSQKCARVSGKASDLEFVGRTKSHHTFFEMLGNFSFGDYFKKDAIKFAWAFVTEELKLSKDKLWITVYNDDLESRDIWRDEMGIPENRIIFCDEKDNFWGPPGPTGPCGPCSEIHYDLGGADTTPDKDPLVLDSVHYIEIWNLVFMELFKDGEGKLSPLEKKNVDTGMGLERIAMVVQGVDNTFETDLLFPLVDQVAKLANTRYKKDDTIDTALKICADHVRCLSFAIADGVIPSNEGRGYIIRMILRRAVRYGKKYLGFNEPFLYKLISKVRDLYSDPYSELKDRYSVIVDTVKNEERKFFETLERGSKMLDGLIEEHQANKQTTISGEDAFKLYDTFGFPLELTADIAQEVGLSVDEDGFEKAMQSQKELARAGQKDKTIVDDQVYSQLFEQVGEANFVGYDHLESDTIIRAIVVDGASVDEVSAAALSKGASVQLVLSDTPFYAESGGQVADEGVLTSKDGTVLANVTDCQKMGRLWVHYADVAEGQTIKVNDAVRALVDAAQRAKSAVHHTSAHLLHAALREVLGDQVQQAGSKVGPSGGRFDFTFARAVKPAELNRIEALMNSWVLENTAQETALMTLDEAKESGAVAMFNEKYGDTVRVVAYGKASKELCGGTHVPSLGHIGLVKITSESAIASGVRRIEYAAGELAYQAFKAQEELLNKGAALLKSPSGELTMKIQKLLDEVKDRDKRIQQLQQASVLQMVDGLLEELNATNQMLVKRMDEMDTDAMKALVEKLSSKASEHVILLATASSDKVMFVCSVSDSYQKQGIQAGKLVKEAASICGGGGGGRPGFAQAGGKDPDKLDEALAQVLDHLNSLETTTV